jgi:hypothetical protein
MPLLFDMAARRGKFVAYFRSSPTVKFLILQKQKTDPPPDSKFFKNRNAHLYRLVRELTPGNGSIR